MFNAWIMELMFQTHNILGRITKKVLLQKPLSRTVNSIKAELYFTHHISQDLNVFKLNVIVVLYSNNHLWSISVMSVNGQDCSRTSFPPSRQSGFHRNSLTRCRDCTCCQNHLCTGWSQCETIRTRPTNKHRPLSATEHTDHLPRIPTQ